MKTTVWITVFIIICLLAVPALAERGGNGRPDAGMERGRRPDASAPVRGTVLSIDARKNVARIALYLRVTDANAPGKIPDRIAQMAVQLSTTLDKVNDEIRNLKAQGKDEQAKRFTDMQQKIQERMEEAKHWREVEVTTAEDTVYSGMISSPVKTIPPGTLVQFFSSVAGRVEPDAYPDTVTLIGQIRNAQPGAQPEITQRHAGGKASPPASAAVVNRVFYSITGSVVTVNPLTVDVKGTRVKVTVPNEKAYLHMERLTLQDLQPGVPITYATITRQGELGVTKVEALLVNPGANSAINPLEGARF